MTRPPSFAYPQNPNPNLSYQLPPNNPSPSFFFQPPPQNPNQYFVVPPPPPPPQPVRDLSGTLASLNSLVSLCQQTLDSLSRNLELDPYSILGKDENGRFVRCPFDPKHLMPPEALFLHSLRCPPPLDLTHLLGSLSYYRDNIEYPCELQLERSGGELCFSSGDHRDSGSSFFYKDCPGVVNLSEIDKVKRTLELPSVLSVDCGDSLGFDEKEKNSTLGKWFRVLPSEFWAMRSEIDSWRDYPTSYSFSVLCAVLGSKMAGNSELKTWIIANSLRYGVIIDTHVRDHIYLLVQLCLKAIVKEACGLAEFDGNANDLKENQQLSSLKNRRFECMNLVHVLTWLASQLAVLYGEGNGKFFALDTFKKCIIESASQIMLFQSAGNMIESPKSKPVEVHKDLDGASNDCKDVKPEEPFDNISEGKSGKSSVDAQVISVSRVAAAVATLHERSLLEEKIRAVRFSQPPTRYQRMAEHDVMTKKADEERRKRPMYRPIIEHDGLPRQRSSNHETNKVKTREELMAEERDYKRRRMSYRGKKVKRTPLQVLRDIIEEYTEEIRLAGGIGCMEKGYEKETTLSFPSSENDQKYIYRDYNMTSTISDDVSPRFDKQSKKDFHRDNECFMDGKSSTDKGKWHKDHDSEISRRQQSHGEWRPDDHSDRRDYEFRRSKHHSIERKSYKQRHRPPSHAKGSSDYRNKWYDEYDRSSKGYRKQYAFEDRYHPSGQE